MSAKIVVQCPQCGKQSRAAAEDIGRKAKCSCDTIFTLKPPTKTSITNKQKTSYPVVTSCTIKRTILGKYEVWYQCPHCKSKIFSTENEMSGLDRCPDCTGIFGFADDVIRSLKIRQSQDRENREQKKSLKNARREKNNKQAKEKRREKQRKKQKEEGLRLVASQERQEQARQKQLSEETGMAASSALNDPATSHLAPDLVSHAARVCWYCQNDRESLIHQCSYCGMI